MEVSMNFFKNLFSSGKEESSFIPTPTQDVPGIEPIVVQAIENLFPNIDDQKYAFNYVLKVKEAGDNEPKTLLTLLAYSNGKIDNLVDPNSPLFNNGHFRIEVISSTFPKMKDAEEWVKSITKSQE